MNGRSPKLCFAALMTAPAAPKAIALQFDVRETKR